MPTLALGRRGGGWRCGRGGSRLTGVRPVPLYEAGEVGLSAVEGFATRATCGLRAPDRNVLYAKDAVDELGLTPSFLAWNDSTASI